MWSLDIKKKIVCSGLHNGYRFPSYLSFTVVYKWYDSLSRKIKIFICILSYFINFSWICGCILFLKSDQFSTFVTMLGYRIIIMLVLWAKSMSFARSWFWDLAKLSFARFLNFWNPQNYRNMSKLSKLTKPAKNFLLVKLFN